VTDDLQIGGSEGEAFEVAEAVLILRFVLVGAVVLFGKHDEGALNDGDRGVVHALAEIEADIEVTEFPGKETIRWRVWLAEGRDISGDGAFEPGITEGGVFGVRNSTVIFLVKDIAGAGAAHFVEEFPGNARAFGSGDADTLPLRVLTGPDVVEETGAAVGSAEEPESAAGAGKRSWAGRSHTCGPGRGTLHQ